MKTNSVLWIACLLFLSACHKRGEQTTDRTPIVKVDTVRATQGGGTLQFPGKVVSSQQLNASFKVAGTLKQVCVKEGERVKAGQLLAEIDPTDYQVQLKATEAEYAQVKAEAERVIGLYKDGGTTASLYDKARYGLEQIEAKLQNHRNQLSYTRIFSPMDGFVQRRYFDAGETIGAGMPIVSVLSVRSIEVEVNIPAVTYLQREHMTGYSCTMDVMPGQQMPLQFLGILPQANANQLYTMRLALNDDTGRIAPGMSVWVSVQMADSTGSCVCIPSTALVHEGHKSCVYLYKESHVKCVPVKVKTLHTDGTAWVDGKIQAGDCVVSAGARHLSDGQEVRLLDNISETNVGGML